MTPTKPSEPRVQELFDLTGQVAMVTGAAGYLGRALATALAEAGASLVVTSRSESSAAQLARELPAAAGQSHGFVALDYLSPESLTAAFAKAVAAMGRIDILVNNGHAATQEDWTTATADGFQRQLANATGYFLLARALRNHAVQQRRAAAVVMMGSMYGLVGSYPDAYQNVSPASPVAYHTLKGGILQMTRHLAVSWAADQVRVNCLCPGPFPDPQRAPQQLVERLQPRVPLGRMGQPHELKAAVVFLASQASSYMTGQALTIDGGWTAW